MKYIVLCLTLIYFSRANSIEDVLTASGALGKTTVVSDSTEKMESDGWKKIFIQLESGKYEIDRESVGLITFILQNNYAEFNKAISNEFKTRYGNSNDYVKQKMEQEAKENQQTQNEMQAVKHILAKETVCTNIYEEIAYNARKKYFSIIRDEPSDADYPSAKNKMMRKFKGWSIPWDTTDTVSFAKLKSISCEDSSCELKLPKDLPEKVKELSGNIRQKVRWCMKGPLKVETVKWHSIRTVPVYYTVPTSIYLEVFSIENKNEILWKSQDFF